jgi:nucleoside-diphosphate-sugar epimerase
MSENIILIGSSGAIGSHILEFFEPELKIMDFQFHDWNNLKLFKDEIHKFLNKLARKNSVIIWTAGATHPRSTSAILNDNARVFETFVDVMNESKNDYDGLKIIYLSSTGSIYPYDAINVRYENSPTIPTSNYGTFKLEQEKLLNELVKNAPLDCIILRSPSVFGSARFKYTGIINQIQHNKEFELKANLATVRQYIHIRDLCSTIGKAIHYSKFEKYIIKNIAPAQNYSISQLITKYGDEKLKERIKISKDVYSSLINQTILVGSSVARDLNLDTYIEA